ncbi:tetratricopeptide repeat protein [Paraburkholderia sp. GAS82]|uniref:tetratricopeptide repeat protein n=1 Tax=Paraburkholderia sp. GAS82 TaxID=3035137 RepID=UPI003D24B684
MGSFTEKSERRVLPLWKNSRYAAQSSEVQPLKLRRLRRIEPNVTDLATRIADFDLQPSIGTAADVLNSAVLSENIEAARSAARYIDARTDIAPLSLLRVARTVLQGKPESSEMASTAISELRRQLRLEPRNPVLQVDIAREYCAIGKLDAAEKAIMIAVACSSGDRWVHRMAARFMVHAGRKDEAHALIAGHPDAKQDPWLLSAEIALAQTAERAPRYWSNAGSLLKGNLPPQHLSELACAVGTLELAGGNSKKAKRNFRAALIAPSDNALAQVKWAERTLRTTLTDDETIAEGRRAFEARFWSAYYRGDMADAMAYARAWWKEEPYSTRPATMLSYVGSLLDHTLVVQEAAKRGLRANPDDRTLQLNLMFAELSALLSPGDIPGEGLDDDRVAPIYKRLLHLARDKHFSAHAYANIGLANYRVGRLEAGAVAYRTAATLAAAANDSIQEATTKIFHAREAFLSGSVDFPVVLDDVRNALNRVKSPGLKFYLSKLELLARYPDRRKEILSPSFSLPRIGEEPSGHRQPQFKIQSGKATIILPKGYKPR